MSLATRITLVVTVLLAACGVFAGLTFYRVIRQQAEAEVGARLDERLAWLEGALEIDLDDGEVQLEAPAEPAAMNGAWEVATHDGVRLWGSGRIGGAPEMIARSRRLSFGPAEGTPLAGAQLAVDAGPEAAGGRSRAGWSEVPVAEVPPAAIEGARKVLAAFEPRNAWRRSRTKKKEPQAPASFELRGPAGGRDHAVRVDANGVVQRVVRHDEQAFTDYQISSEMTGEGASPHLVLVITAASPAAEASAEVARAARVMWTLGPLALLATSVVLALVIRWQLRPLARVAAQAAGIGPKNTNDRIAPAGTTTELVTLRRAMNAMIERLQAAIGRERTFASTAAHELRTPLAQMRLAVDVALRRERDAGEYREALAEISQDIARLERLVVGLLQLSRQDVSEPRGDAPTQSADLDTVLRRAIEERGPARVIEPLGAAAARNTAVRVCGDADLLCAAIGNVLENAARHAPGEPPEVRIEPGDDGEVWMSVTDSGPGIAEADRERIFEPLTRLAASEVDAAPGFGLGLAVARSSVRSFGGDLTCAARNDGRRGAEFRFRLRLAPKHSLSS